MDIEEEKNRQGNINSPTREKELMVDLNSDLMKTIQSLQVDIHSLKDDNMNERREQKKLNESLLHNLTGVNPHGQPTHSTNKSKENYHYKRRTTSPKEEG